MNSAQDNCPNCGAPLADGLCPQCLLLAGMEPTPTSSRARWVPPTPEELQAQLTGYQVLELLGLGGMGAVYKGCQNSLERHVAIKVLPPGLTEEDEPFTARFKHEAKTMARLSHPAIVSVHDYGETAEGLCYIVMEFVEGTDVQRMMAEHEKLPPEHALAIAMHVCDALVYAHEHGIIHRDIKPANVMVDTQGRVRVADFGLAKATDAGGTLLTATNMAMGTPGYIAPETLIMGMSVDARADVYAVGVMLYAMLTGRVPHGRFEAASVRVPGLDPRFDDIINHAMQDDREARYASAAELRADLATILNEPQEAASARFAKAASSAQLQKSRAGPATQAEPRPRIPMALIGLAAFAVCAIGLQMWKPWAKSEGPQAGNSKAQASNSKEGSSSKGQGNATKPSENSVRPRVSAPNPTSTGFEATPPAESAGGTGGTPSSPAAPTAPKPNTPHVPVAAASVPAKMDAPAAIAESNKPPPVPAPSAGATASSTPTVQNAALVTPAAVEKVALPAELAALDAQFRSLQVERVAAPFEAEVAKLNTSYVGGLEREMPKEKAAGDLDGLLALEAEKKLLNDHQPVPSLEEEIASEKETPAALKSLRVIYRDAQAKLEAQRAANLKSITDPLTVRLQGLESEFTKKDRIADAKIVREYRESLGSALGGDVAEAGAAPAVALATPAKSIAPMSGPVTLKDGFTNTLGMKFMHVPGTKVLFCIHETRYKDYASFAAEASELNSYWKAQTDHGYTLTGRTDEHPVTNVNWDDAQKFCTWLSKKEGKTYRLPTDREWSFAVGIGRDEPVTKDTTPESLSAQNLKQYPWGTQWPPPKGAGNFSDQSTRAKAPRPNSAYIDGYDDGFPTTAPVMSFKPNKLGLYDMSGNVAEWCEDWFNGAKKERVLRGASWCGGGADRLYSSFRIEMAPDSYGGERGFRVVVEEAVPFAPPPQTIAAPPPRTPLIAPTVGAVALKDGFTNTLGMKFMHVPGTKVLFCIHETRYQDYAAYAAEASDVEGSWKYQSADGFALTGRADEHPVANVIWEDAQKFCAWLSKKEGKTYRLPTDREWSIAIDVGRDEKWNKDTTPATVLKNPTEYPWGNKWPPPKGAGNYSDQSRKAKAPRDGAQYVDDYDDGFPTTSPVMSFKPNEFGLHDLSGNVWEWCEDWYDNAQKARVVRGGSMACGDRTCLLSSSRGFYAPDYRNSSIGFRLVVEAQASSAAPALPAAAAPQTVAAPPPRTPLITPTVGGLQDGFTNSLGMKFMHVPGTNVLFCIHHTRVQDYKTFVAKARSRVESFWTQSNQAGVPIGNKDDHPVVAVSWEDAKAFCAWLSNRERRTYRLPTDREWSLAAGLGNMENPTKDDTPESLSGKLKVFVWGNQWPPPPLAGNFADTACKEKFPTAASIDGYTDGFPTTSPVMSFKPNEFGLHDMAGNVWQFCEDLMSPTSENHVTRGGCWNVAQASNSYSSIRVGLSAKAHFGFYGFRVVVESQGAASSTQRPPTAPTPSTTAKNTVGLNTNSPKKKLTTSERKLIESWLINKTWEIKNPAGADMETYYFAKDGKAARMVSGQVSPFVPSAGWRIEDDGTIIVGYGYMKQIHLTSPDAGTVVIIRKDDQLDCTIGLTADVPDLTKVVK